MTVMSYKIWKEQCASGKNAALQTKAHIDEADQRSCKRLLDRPNRKESSSSKPYSRSPPVLSRPHSSANVDWPLVTSSCSKHGTENRFTNEEYCRVTLPTIPPMTVLIRRDGSPIASSIAPLQPTITSEQLAFTSSQNQTPSEPSSTPNAAVSTSASPLLRTPIAVNHMPSCDVRMSTASTEDGVVSALSAALHPSNDVFSSIIHRPSPSMPNSQNLLKLPLNMVTSHSTIASQPSAVASAIDNQVDALATLSFRVPQPNAIRDGLTQALQNEALTRFLPAALSSQSNPALLAQQQQQQQRAAQQILSNTSVGNLIGTAPLQTAPELFNTAAANTSSGGGLIPALAASGTLPVPNVDEAAASLLRQLHQQQQLQQRIENANLLTSSDLLKVYQMLSDPIASQALQAQLKQLEHSGLLLGQSIAT
ncbi:unnamed protein product [Toxocara canis]|uniref:Uncharacterized protein n=1 Tax=Toxocara canis TaxID=6265 RepID=A0A183VCI9_TOXCA|nr:unnamed protein product [Toxocara canis]